MSGRNPHIDDFMLQLEELISEFRRITESTRRTAYALLGKQYYGQNAASTVKFTSATAAIEALSLQTAEAGKGKADAYRVVELVPESAQWGIVEFSRFGNVGRERPTPSSAKGVRSSLSGSR